jgi:VanZ family protein
LSSTPHTLEAQPVTSRAGRGASRGFVRDWLPVLAYVAVIFTVSAQPNLSGPLHFQNSDKVSHLLEYGGLGWLLGRALRHTFGWPISARAALIAVAIGALVGGADEWFQSHVPGRDSSMLDWCADASGLVLAQVFDLVFAKDAPPRG